MQKENRSIEIVRSSVSSLSSMSTRSVEPLFALLSERFSDVRITIADTAADLQGIAERKPDLVFLTVKCVPVEGGSAREDSDLVWVGDFLDTHGITYTGSPSSAHKLELYKPLAKQRAIECGLNTSRFCVVKQGLSFSADEAGLTYPLFIKPSDRGGGMGVDEYSVAHTQEEADVKIASIAANHGADALVEEYLTGREFSVAVLRNPEGDAYEAMPLELATSEEFEGAIMSQEMKNANTEIVLPVTDTHIREQICTLAIAIFKALGARDYGRIDIKFNGRGEPQFLEANLIPSLIEDYGSFPKACVLNHHISYEEMILRITNLGLSRSNKG